MPNKFDISQLEGFRDNIKNFDTDAFIKSCCKELGARLLRKTKFRTPVKTGNLRRNWFVDETVSVNGKKYKIDVFNSTEYAPYVEYGHRTRNHNGWVEGCFMLTESENELRDQTDRILKLKLEKALKDLNKK